MEMTAENMPACRVACIRRTGPYGAGNEATMEELKKWARANGLFGGEAVILGIALDDPETTRPEDCRYDACVLLPDGCAIANGGVEEGRIAGGKYAVFCIEHTAEAVRKAWSDIFPELLRRGLRFDEARPVMERYAAKMVGDHLCEICVPVR